MKNACIVILFCSGLAIFSGCTNAEPTGDSTGLYNDTETVKKGDLTSDDIAHGVTDSVTESDCTDARLTQGKRNLIGIVWDGWQNEAGILESFRWAKSNSTDCWSRICYSYFEGSSKPDDIKNKVQYWVDYYKSNYNKNKSELCLMIVGKSMGGARSYRTMYENYSGDNGTRNFEDFFKTVWVLVDAHNPTAPADSGRCDEWYNYVRLDCYDEDGDDDWNDHYNLKMYQRWKDHITPDSYSCQLGIFNTYERVDNLIKGYSFNGRDNGSGPGYTFFEKKQYVEHMEIDTTESTKYLIKYGFIWASVDK